MGEFSINGQRIESRILREPPPNADALWPLLQQLTTHQIVEVAAHWLHEQVKQEFIKGHNFTESKGHPCYLRLANPKAHCTGIECADLPARDHACMFNRDGQPYCLVYHPYHLEAPQMQRLAALCEKYKLRAHVDGQSWYFSGRSLRITLTREGDYVI